MFQLYNFFNEVVANVEDNNSKNLYKYLFSIYFAFLEKSVFRLRKYKV